MNSQSTDSNEFDHSGMVHFRHLLSLSQEVLHLLTVVTVSSYEVTHCEGVRVCRCVTVRDVWVCCTYAMYRY